MQFSEPVLAALDRVFFLLGGVAAGWLAVLTVRQIIVGGIDELWLLVVLWLLLAYLLLPRIHTMLAIVYVPDYFIGRARTYEGLLGDPVNLALLGREEQLHRAMSLAHWRRADELGFRSALRIVASTLGRRSYPTAPVSPLFLFGRMQDFTYQQEVEGSPERRHHVRFWRTPTGWFLPGGGAVDWLAAATFDRSVGLSIFTLQITHKIDADTDVERDYAAGTLLAADQRVEEAVIRHFSSGYHSRNGGGDAIETDGDLPVLDLRPIPVDRAPGLPHPGLRHARGSLGEQARSLLETVKDTSSSNRIKRPVSLYVGYVLMLIRGVVALGTSLGSLIGILRSSSGAPAQTAWLGLAGSPETMPLAIAGILASALIYVALAQFTFTGHAAARLLALTLSVVGIVLALTSGPPDPSGLLFRIWVLNLGLDICILITLSSGDARDFDIRSAYRRARGAVLSAQPT